MSEKEQKQHQTVEIPIKWVVPESIIGRYVHNVIVQPGRYELNIFFFENQIPPYVGSAEEIKENLLKEGSVRAECVSKIIVDPEFLPDIIEALQTGLKNYNEGKAAMERERIDEYL